MCYFAEPAGEIKTDPKQMVVCVGQALQTSADGFYRRPVVFNVMFGIPRLRRLVISNGDVKANRRMKTTVDPECNGAAEQNENPLTPRRLPNRVKLHFAIAWTGLRLDERQTNAWTMFEDVPSVWFTQDAVGVPRLDWLHRTNPFVVGASQTPSTRCPSLAVRQQIVVRIEA
jgi:hypothetical protein